MSPARLLTLESSWSYLDAIWFLMVTASTVGFGDLYPETSLGKLAVIFYLLGNPTPPPPRQVCHHVVKYRKSSSNGPILSVIKLLLLSVDR